jgi:hypothetical protein
VKEVINYCTTKGFKPSFKQNENYWIDLDNSKATVKLTFITHWHTVKENWTVQLHQDKGSTNDIQCGRNHIT